MKTSKGTAAGLLFLVPWSFLGLWWDAARGGMLGYLVCGIALVVLSWVLLKHGALWLGAAGHLLSGVVSWLCACRFLGSEWNYYFKPLTAGGLTVGITAAALIIYGIAAFDKAKRK